MSRARKTKIDSLTALFAAPAVHLMRRIYRASMCPCGCGGSWANYVSGTIGMESAVWMGCCRRGGSAVGTGVTGEQCAAVHAILAACDRLGVSIDDVMDTAPKQGAKPYSLDAYSSGPLVLRLMREDYESLPTDALRRDFARSQRLAERGIDLQDVLSAE